MTMTEAPSILESGVLEKTALETYVPLAKPSLVGLSREELAQRLGEIGVAEKQRKMRVQQLWHWMYVRGAQTFADMTNVSKDMRAELEKHFTVDRPEVVAEQISNDGTRKWLLRLPGDVAGRAHEVECVYIPETDRGTLCVSSQVGCTLTCSFCHTGTQRLVRNLTAGEILGQVMVARDRLGDWIDRETPNGNRLVTNVVMMGMGEPLMNFDNVVRAMSVMRDDLGYGLANKRVTLSTSGLVPQIDRLSAESDVSLAVSLHAPNDALRETLVPLNKKYPIAELMASCARYLRANKRRESVTFEYTLMKGINDKPEHARELARLMRQFDNAVQAKDSGKVNLIPFNPFPGTRYERSEEAHIRAFQKILLDSNVLTMVRRTRGDDIDAACGQLKGQVMDRTRRQAEFNKTLQAGKGSDAAA